MKLMRIKKTKKKDEDLKYLLSEEEIDVARCPR